MSDWAKALVGLGVSAPKTAGEGNKSTGGNKAAPAPAAPDDTMMGRLRRKARAFITGMAPADDDGKLAVAVKIREATSDILAEQLGKIPAEVDGEIRAWAEAFIGATYKQAIAGIVSDWSVDSKTVGVFQASLDTLGKGMGLSTYRDTKGENQTTALLRMLAGVGAIDYLDKGRFSRAYVPSGHHKTARVQSLADRL